MKSAWKLLAGVCLLVVGVYAYMAQSSAWELLSQDAADSNYNLLVQGFRDGQLSLKKEVPPGFAQLADPYDPAAHFLYQGQPYRMIDLSYYKGRFYLYWGVTPALLLFWPFVALTGQYLFHRQAVAIFCVLGFLASAGWLYALWRRYFAEVSVVVVMACALALGLATGVPVLLSHADVYQVPISCGYMLTMLALAAIWRALHEPERRCRWLAAASVAYGLAVGARPSLLFGAVILLVPVIHAWRERRQVWAVLLAATGPIALIGLGLMLYNFLRFGNPFEFGLHYQLNGEPRVAQQFFSLRCLWFNFRVYFLEPARWTARLPFVHNITMPPLPEGYRRVEDPFGVLTNIPVVWLALAVPLAWRRRSAEVGILRWFVTVVVLLFGICALTLGLYRGAAIRFEVEFLQALLLLAVVGILGLERALADRPAWRCAARWGWGLLLGFSVAFNLLVTAEHYAEAHNVLGMDLGQSGRLPEAMREFERAVWIAPDYAPAHNSLGIAFTQLGRMQEALLQFQQAARLNPDDPEAHYVLGAALKRAGKVSEAIEQYGQTLRLKPEYAEAHVSLGIALEQVGRVPEAMEHYKQALQIKPDLAEAHYNLGAALEQTGQVREAITHYKQALRIKPHFTEAQNALARLQARQ